MPLGAKLAVRRINGRFAASYPATGSPAQLHVHVAFVRREALLSHLSFGWPELPQLNLILRPTSGKPRHGGGT